MRRSDRTRTGTGCGEIICRRYQASFAVSCCDCSGLANDRRVAFVDGCFGVDLVDLAGVDVGTCSDRACAEAGWLADGSRAQAESHAQCVGDCRDCSFADAAGWLRAVAADDLRATACAAWLSHGPYHCGESADSRLQIRRAEHDE